MRTKKGAAYAGMVIVNVLWGLSFIASKYALSNGFAPFSLALVRFAIASVLLIPILVKREGFHFPRQDFARLLLSSLFGMTLYFLFEYKGLERTSASTASLIIGAIPAFTLLYGVIFRKKRYSPICYMGVLVSLAGVYLIVSHGAGDGGDTLLGNLLIVGAVLCWVGYIQTTDALLHKHSSLMITCWQSVLGALTLIPLALTERMDFTALTPAAWGMALYLAILCSVVAYLIYANAIRVLQPFATSLFANINPLAAVVGGVVLLNESVTPVQLLGGALVLISLFLVNSRGMEIYRRFGKRALDVTLSLVAVAVLSPVMGAVALAVRLDSKGPILFRQRRVGRDKTFFTILKFRTMYVDTPGDTPTHLLKDAKRCITRVGRFLRRTSLDELPQLFNIIRGDMSIVGPRPALWNQADLIAARDQHGANALVPGLTGLAQVSGRDELPIPEKAKLDGEYARRVSFALDAWCVWRTARNVLSGSGVVEGGR